jgi:hypothetical protein
MIDVRYEAGTTRKRHHINFERVHLLTWTETAEHNIFSMYKSHLLIYDPDWLIHPLNEKTTPTSALTLRLINHSRSRSVVWFQAGEFTDRGAAVLALSDVVWFRCACCPKKKKFLGEWSYVIIHDSLLRVVNGYKKICSVRLLIVKEREKKKSGKEEVVGRQMACLHTLFSEVVNGKLKCYSTRHDKKKALKCLKGSEGKMVLTLSLYRERYQGFSYDVVIDPYLPVSHLYGAIMSH